MQVLIVVKKNILNKVIIENRIDFVNYPYCIILDTKELNQVLRQYLRRTRIVNLYDNKIGWGCIWQRSNSTI